MNDAPLLETPPAAAAPEAAPEPVTPPPPAASAPAAEPAPAVVPETAATDTAASVAAKEPTSLLSDAATPAPEPKAEAPAAETPAETPKPEGEAPVTEAPPVEAPLPSYEVFTVPEGVELEDAQVDRFVGTLASFERRINPTGSPEIHAAVQEFAQQALDQYTDEIASLAERVREANADTFGRTMESWKNEFFSDPVIGGNRKDTTLRNVGAVISRFGGTPQQIAELRSVYSTTGAGNHKLVLNLFNNIAEFLGEGGAVAAQKPEPQQSSRKERRYGKGN